MTCFCDHLWILWISMKGAGASLIRGDWRREVTGGLIGVDHDTDPGSWSGGNGDKVNKIVNSKQIIRLDRERTIELHWGRNPSFYWGNIPLICRIITNWHKEMRLVIIFLAISQPLPSYNPSISQPPEIVQMFLLPHTLMVTVAHRCLTQYMSHFN